MVHKITRVGANVMNPNAGPNFETYLASETSEHERAIKMPPTARNLCARLPPRDFITRRFHGENADLNRM